MYVYIYGYIWARENDTACTDYNDKRTSWRIGELYGGAQNPGGAYVIHLVTKGTAQQQG